MADATEFTEHQRVLGLFADGLAGRAVPIDVVDDERAVWPWQSSSVDGEVVRVPAVAADRGVLRATVLHHTGFSEFGSFDDDDRADREQLFLAAPQPGSVRRIFGMLEDARIDRSTRARYPGARADLDRLLARARANGPMEPPAGWRDTMLESLQLHSLGEARAVLLDRVGVGRRASLSAILDLVEPLETAADNARAALSIGRLLDADELDVEGDPTFAVTDAVDTDGEGSLERPDDPDRPDADLPRPPSLGMRQEETEHTMLGRLADLDAADPEAATDEEELAAGGRPSTRVEPAPADDHGARVFFYDEWDHVAERHLPAWCRVLERRLDGDDHTFLADVRRRHGALINRLRRQLAFMRPEGWVRVHHADEGDELDLDAVIEAVVDRRTGHAVDDRLHVRRDRAVRDVATAFLVDLSASTSAPLPADADVEDAPAGEEPIMYRGGWLDAADLAPPEVGRRILDVATESVAVMCDALERLGDRHAVYGFSGEGRHHVDVHVAKDFDDRASPATWAALAAMRSLKYTRMGPAVRHATARLAAQPARTKLLVVISDGYPQDVDYGPVRGDREYGLQDTARAMRDAVGAGVTPYCLTIDPAGHDYLRRMLPERSYVVIDDVDALPQELATLYGSVASRSSRGW